MLEWNQHAGRITNSTQTGIYSGKWEYSQLTSSKPKQLTYAKTTFETQRAQTNLILFSFVGAKTQEQHGVCVHVHSIVSTTLYALRASPSVSLTYHRSQRISFEWRHIIIMHTIHGNLNFICSCSRAHSAHSFSDCLSGSLFCISNNNGKRCCRNEKQKIHYLK